VPQACDASLKRLGVEAIDIYGLQSRRPKVPIGGYRGAMKNWSTGQGAYLALSEAARRPAARAQGASARPRSNEYSLWSRDVE